MYFSLPTFQTFPTALESYKTSAYLSADTGALDMFFLSSPVDTDSQVHDSSPEDVNTTAPITQDEIPQQQVCITCTI